MKKQLIIVGIIVLLICVGLSGCNNPLNTERNRFIGSWIGTESIIYGTTETKILENLSMIFLSDGTLSEGFTGGGTWEIKDGKLVINDGIGMRVFNYSFSNNDNSLLLISSSNKFVLTKQ